MLVGIDHSVKRCGIDQPLFHKQRFERLGSQREVRRHNLMIVIFGMHEIRCCSRTGSGCRSQANKTEDQAVADKPLAPIGKILGSTQQVDDNMVRMVYRSLKNTPANPA
jgi:hypothetical protein